MPMRWKRAKALVKRGLAKVCSTKDRILYLKLKYKPSGENFQDIHLGIDPGSMFDGFTILSRKDHNFNCELIHTKDISKRMEKRSTFRRIRRSRLWHRPSRFDHRTSSKLVPTIRSKIMFRVYMILELLKLFPISKVIVEDVKFNHYKHKHQGGSFSPIEVGKTYLYDTIKSLGLSLQLVSGIDTYKRRNELFPDSPKEKNKACKSFWAHCVDSTTLSIMGFEEWEGVGTPNISVHFIERIHLSKRELFRTKSRIGDKKNYFKYIKGNIKVPFKKLNQPRKLRVKINDSKSNHGPWDYLYQERLESFKSFQSRYGGTIILGGPSWKTKDIGQSKRLVNGNYHEYKNRNIEII